MKLELAQKMVELNPNLTLHTDYSGRFMYGKITNAVSGSKDDLMEVLVGLPRNSDGYMYVNRAKIRKRKRLF